MRLARCWPDIAHPAKERFLKIMDLSRSINLLSLGETTGEFDLALLSLCSWHKELPQKLAPQNYWQTLIFRKQHSKASV